MSISQSILRYWPLETLPSARARWDILGNTISGGQSVDGTEQLAALSGGGLWSASLLEFNLWSEARRRTWKSLRAILDGGAQPIILPMYNTFDAPWPIVGGMPLRALPIVGHSDDAFFSDGSGYVSSPIQARLAQDALLRDTEVMIEIVTGEDLQGGEIFSIDHEGLRHRPYQIGLVEDNGDGTFNVAIRPPLRGDVEAFTPVDFNQPKCVMKLARADSMSAEYERPERAKPSVDFIEAFPPFPS